MGMQNEDGSYSETRRLVAHDVDVNNKLKISAIFSNIQETANSQCACFGCGWNEHMTNYRVCYVLSRMRFRMDSKHTIKMRIFAGKRKTFYRCFIIRSGIDHRSDPGPRSGSKALAGIAAEGFIVIMGMYVDQHISNTASCRRTTPRSQAPLREP